MRHFKICAAPYFDPCGYSFLYGRLGRADKRFTALFVAVIIKVYKPYYSAACFAVFKCALCINKGVFIFLENAAIKVAFHSRVYF